MFLIKVISGSDLPSLTISHIKSNFDFLESPIRDGKQLSVTFYFLTENYLGEFCVTFTLLSPDGFDASKKFKSNFTILTFRFIWQMMHN